MQKTLWNALVAAAVLAVPIAHADIMTFGYGAPVAGQGYIENGFMLSQITGNLPTAERIRDWATTVQGPDPTFDVTGGYGERELMFSETAGQVIFSRTDGGRFHLLGFDVENPTGLVPWSAGGSFTIEASNGYRKDVLAYTYGPALDALGEGGVIPFQMDAGLKNITWFSISCAACQLTLDNIEFRPVPEPKSIYLFSFGVFFAAGFYRRKMVT
jgi:hypothetical protein